MGVSYWTGSEWAISEEGGAASIRAVADSFAAAAAGDYADNDVISNSVSNGTGQPLEFVGVPKNAGGAAKIVGATLSMSKDNVVGTTELQLFSQAPTATELDDNAAEGGIGAADQPYYLGKIDFPALADVGAFSFSRATSPTPASPLLVFAAARSIFGRLIWRDAETNEAAGMTVTVTLYVDDE